MLCNKNYHIAVGQLYFKNKQTNKLIEKEIRFVVTIGGTTGGGRRKWIIQCHFLREVFSDQPV